MDYSFSIKVGFKILENDLGKVFMKGREPNHHYEIDGRNVDLCELGFLVAEKVGCQASLGGCYITGPLFWIFHLDLDMTEEAMDEGFLRIGTEKGLNIPVRALEGFEPKLAEIKAALNNLGIEVGEAAVFLDWCIS